MSILLKKLFESNTFSGTKIIFCSIIIILFLIPVTLPVEEKNWIDWSDFRPTIYNGATYFQIPSHDWHHAMDWLQHNTPENSIIASWWDYGYWIQTLGDRTTIVDNSTLIDWQIKKLAHAFVTTPENSWRILNSSYDQDVSQYIGDERILAFKTI